MARPKSMRCTSSTAARRAGTGGTHGWQSTPPASINILLPASIQTSCSCVGAHTAGGEPSAIACDAAPNGRTEAHGRPRHHAHACCPPLHSALLLLHVCLIGLVGPGLASGTRGNRPQLSSPCSSMAFQVRLQARVCAPCQAGKGRALAAGRHASSEACPDWWPQSPCLRACGRPCRPSSDPLIGRKAPGPLPGLQPPPLRSLMPPVAAAAALHKLDE